MGTRGLEIVRFRGRYYIRWHRFDSYFEGLGAKIVASIPTDPEKYNSTARIKILLYTILMPAGWLESMRAQYAAKESVLDRDVYEIRDGVKPDYSQFEEFESLPSDFPELNNWAEYIYIINLDHEVLTMNHTIHWKLGNVPRQDDLWLRAIVGSIYRYESTISPEICPEEHMASPALEYPEPTWDIKYDFRIVSPRTDIAEAPKAFVTQVLADTISQYETQIITFGKEWSPSSFPFRELTFALVSIASGQTKFHSFPVQECNPRTCQRWTCKSSHLHRLPGWVDEEWVGDSAPLLEFGSPAHRPGEPPGASPMETIYWVEDVLVSLALVVDGDSISKAVAWGVERGHTNFQIVILSLFEVAFAEVSFDGEAGPFAKASKAVKLSPLRVDACASTHPRQRPELKPGMEAQNRDGKRTVNSDCKGTIRRLQRHFPGLAALVNFFEVVSSRRAASKLAGILPLELYDRIVDFVDYDTWKTCLQVSTGVRSCCLRKYRLDDHMRIVSGPFVRQVHHYRYTQCLMSFDFEDMKTGQILPMMHAPGSDSIRECNWVPVIGSDRKAIMLDIMIQFKPVEDVPVEDDSDDDFLHTPLP